MHVARVAAVAIVFRARDRLCADGVQVDVAADFQEVALLLDQMALEPSLEQVPRPAMPPVEITCIAAVEILHAGRQIRLGCLDEQMVVIAHEHERMEPPAVHFDGSPEPVESLVAVRIVSDNRFSFVPSRHHMIQRPGELNSQRPCHAPTLAETDNAVNGLTSNGALTPVCPL